MVWTAEAEATSFDGLGGSSGAVVSGFGGPCGSSGATGGSVASSFVGLSGRFPVPLFSPCALVSFKVFAYGRGVGSEDVSTAIGRLATADQSVSSQVAVPLCQDAVVPR